MLAKMGPARNSNSVDPWLKTDTPVTSDGKRSGVNWMRFQVSSTVAAMARAREVFPVPGTSSMSRCPSARRQMTACLMTSSLPWMTRPTLVTSRSKRLAKLAVAWWVSVSK